jgi:hypothetical protein
VPARLDLVAFPFTDHREQRIVFRCGAIDPPHAAGEVGVAPIQLGESLVDDLT